MANGIIIIDKPAGWTSMDVCAKLRGILKTKKVGHAGTLDPMATGVLPVFVGQATRAVSFAEDGQKEYVAGLRLGRTTDTQDTSGETLDTHPVLTGREDLEHLLPRFTGSIEQVPPMYSAIKIGGQKLYQIARRGGEVERPARPVTIHELELLGRSGPADYTLRIRCSKGTYVRTLCHDIGQALGCGGCMSSLRRTMAAGFTLDDAVTLDRAQQEGEALQRKFQEKLDRIGQLLSGIEPYEKSRVSKIRQRIEDGLAAIPAVEYDRGRLEQEMIYYIEKLDISEEKQRLANHLRYFRETMEEGHGQGKKLGFIAQEMGREINTTGSKSNLSEMQNLVVMMKDELEQIKEQVLNVM